MADFWQMVWEQDVHLIVTLSSIDAQECRPYWPDQCGTSIFFETSGTKIKVAMLDLVDAPGWRAYRLSIEVWYTTKNLEGPISINANLLQHWPSPPHASSPPTSRQAWLLHSPAWPQRCSPLSAAFDLIKAADEEHAALGGPILAVDR